MYRFSRSSIRNMQGVDKRLVLVAHRAIRITKIDFGIPSTGGLRTVEQQRWLYEQGRSTADGILNVSAHQKGKALDFFPLDNGAAKYTREHCAMVAAAFLQAGSQLGVKLSWGGLFSSYFDGPHIELAE